MRRWLPALFFVGILILAIFLRLYLLGSVPAGLTNDEANTGYDAYSLLLTGKDQWGHFLPISFQGFGDYPAPLYRYVTVPFVAIFGLNAFAVRLPSALFGIFMVVGVFFLTKKLFSTRLALLSMFFIAASPWAIGMSRVGLESNAAICLLVFTLLLFAFVKKGKPAYFFAATILLVITIFTYASYTLLAPTVFILFASYFLWKKYLSVKTLGIGTVILVISFLPIILNRNATAASRFSQIGMLHNISSIGLVNTLNDQRGACQTYLPHMICRIENNKIILFSSTLFTNYISHFSLDFLYISGTQTQYSILYTRGLEYLFESILFILGILYLFRQQLSQKSILILLLVSAVPDALTSSGNYSRALSMLPFLAITEATGAYMLFGTLTKIRQEKIKLAIITACSFFFLGAVGIFAVTYFTYFRDYYSRFSQYGYQPLMQRISNYKNSYDQIYVTTHLNDAKQYVYYLFYTKYNPLAYQSKKRVTYHIGSDGWVSVDSIDNIFFVSSLPSIETMQEMQKTSKRILLISHPSDFPRNPNRIFTVKDRIGYGLFEAVDMSSFLADYSQQHAISQDIQQ